MTVAGLNLAHAQLDATVMAATGGKVHSPALIDFVPDRPNPEPEPERPRTFEEWARALLPLAGG